MILFILHRKSFDLWKRFDVAESLKFKKYSHSGWNVNLTLDALSVGDTIIKAWFYDQDAKEFIKLNGQRKVKILS